MDWTDLKIDIQLALSKDKRTPHFILSKLFHGSRIKNSKSDHHGFDRVLDKIAKNSSTHPLLLDYMVKNHSLVFGSWGGSIFDICLNPSLSESTIRYIYTNYRNARVDPLAYHRSTPDDILWQIVDNGSKHEKINALDNLRDRKYEVKCKMLNIINKSLFLGDDFKIIKIKPSIYHIKFKTQKDMTSTLFRFQEYYESNNFKGVGFTAKEFVNWQKTANNGRFTYFSDWVGFNFPSSVLKDFLKHDKFKKLYKREISILEYFQKMLAKNKEFYVIATYGDNEQALDHELIHSKFFLNKEYRKRVEKIIKGTNSWDLDPITDWLASKGYHKDVFIDEINAYLVVDKMHESLWILSGDKERLRIVYKKLKALYEKYYGAINETKTN